MKKKIGILLLLSILYTGSYAQQYNTGVGFRLGGLNSGLTVKHFVNSSDAIEGIASFGHRSFVLTGLYERHFDIENAEGLNWLVGGGAHLGFFRYGGSYYIYRHRGDIVYVTDEGATRTVGGLDFILGLDYKFKNAPINIGLDIKPFVDFFEFPTGYFDGGLSFRFVF